MKVEWCDGEVCNHAFQHIQPHIVPLLPMLYSRSRAAQCLCYKYKMSRSLLTHGNETISPEQSNLLLLATIGHRCYMRHINTDNIVHMLCYIDKVDTKHDHIIKRQD